MSAKNIERYLLTNIALFVRRLLVTYSETSFVSIRPCEYSFIKAITYSVFLINTWGRPTKIMTHLFHCIGSRVRIAVFHVIPRSLKSHDTHSLRKFFYQSEKNLFKNHLIKYIIATILQIARQKFCRIGYHLVCQHYE